MKRMVYDPAANSRMIVDGEPPDDPWLDFQHHSDLDVLVSSAERGGVIISRGTALRVWLSYSESQFAGWMAVQGASLRDMLPFLKAAGQPIMTPGELGQIDAMTPTLTSSSGRTAHRQ